MFSVHNLLIFLGCLVLWVLTVWIIWRFAEFIYEGVDPYRGLVHFLLKVVFFFVMFAVLALLVLLSCDSTMLLVRKLGG